MALFLESEVKNPSNKIVKERLTKASLSLTQFNPATSLYLFGSRSRDTNRFDSDVDLLVVMTGKYNLIDEKSSIFHYPHKEKLEKEILKILGNNPYNGNKPFAIDLIGGYELRFFDVPEVLSTAVKFNIFK